MLVCYLGASLSTFTQIKPADMASSGNKCIGCRMHILTI